MQGSEDSPFRSIDGGLSAAVRVTPKASRTKVTGLARDADGAACLAVAVTATPEDGKANVALIKLLAKEWRLAKSAITIASGTTSRRKTLHIAGDSRRLLLDLGAWLTDMR